MITLLTAFSEDDFQFAIEENLFGLTMNNDSATKEMLMQAHEAGLSVALFNTKIQSAHVDAVEKNPDYIITDNILLLQQILK